MGESYPCVERYGHLERYLPRYTTPARYLDPYSRRDIYLPPPRYLRPLHRYTPRPTRVEYRAHVEYLGSSGGRFVRTPPLGRSEEVSRRVEPPPLALCCNQQPQPTPSRPLTQRHLHTSPTPPPSAPTQPLTPTPTPPPPTPTIWRNVGQSPTSSSPSPPSQTTSTTPPSMMDSGVYSRSGVSSSETPSSCSSVQPSSGGGPVRTQSEPAPAPQPHRAPPPPLVSQQSVPVTKLDWQHAHSRTEILKQKLKKNTAIFFGVDEATQEKERTIWLGRRKRLASRRCGQLKEDPTTPSLKVGTPEVGQLSKDETDSRLTHKPSVAKMTFNGLALLVAALNKQQQRSTTVVDGGELRRPSSNSYSMRMFGHETTPHSPTDDEVFFDSVVNLDTRHPAPPPPQAFGDDANSELLVAPGERPRERHNSWKREGRREESPKVGLNRISGKMLDRAHDNSDRKQFGQGIIPRLFGRSLKRSVMSRGPIKEQLEDLEDHRPFFTYWLSTVQILILFISLISYGFGPFGMDLTHQSGLVLVTSLSLQQVEYTEPANFWLGPRAADLIHLGAKFAPCMRRDAKIMKEIEKGRERERETACCIRNDDSGCVQLSQVECSSTISTWKKWGPGDVGPGGRISGSVCGLDPKYCEAPASVAPYEWPDDITKWPICRKTSSPVQRLRPKDKLAAEHMVCEVIGHPCCIGIHATCKITTKEYCDFVHGTFHDEASLCSQVSCLTDVCGMLPFINSEVPDQFYRLVTSIFLHAGLIQLGISLWIQWFLMRDLEKLTGTARLIIIYIGSGVAGNLASAIFIPYRADVGPAGSQSGLLACLIVEIFNVWPMLRHPYRALLKHLAIAAALFLIGLLPWFDNFSSFFGFLFGFLLSYALLPFASLGEYDRQKKIFIIWVCLLTAIFLFLLLVLFFYVIPVYDCELCGYFNCLPLTRDFCSAQNINFKRADSPV